MLGDLSPNAVCLLQDENLTVGEREEISLHTTSAAPNKMSLLAHGSNGTMLRTMRMRNGGYATNSTSEDFHCELLKCAYHTC